MSHYTGFENYKMFRACCNFLKLHRDGSAVSKRAKGSGEDRRRKSGGGRKDRFTLEEQFFLTLVRLRRGTDEQMLADIYGTTQSTVSCILQKMVNYTYLRLGMIPIWPSTEDVAANLPTVFQELYPSTFLVIDCTELRCEVPSSLPVQSQLYSTYKEHTTLKSLLAMTPDGAVAFVSPLYGGSISDRELTQRSGFLDMLKTAGKGASVMADKGFDIQDLLVSSGVKLNIPPFLQKGAQFSADDVERTQQIAKVRIHVERLIERVKDFNILTQTIPLTLFPSVNQLWTVCCLLTLFQTPVLSRAAEETGMEQGTGSSTSQPKVSKTHVAVAGGENVMKQQESSSSPASQPKASTAPDTSAVGEAVLKQQDGGCSPSSQANVSAARGTGGNDEVVVKQQDSGSSIRSQPNASTTHEKCLSCCRSDGPILRTCKECGGRYHHFCQQDDEDGHYCNLCFKYMGRNTACQKAV